MVTKNDLQIMFSPLPDAIRKRYLDLVLTQMEPEKKDREIFLYIFRILFHDFIKPLDMMNALSGFASIRDELGIKGIALDWPEVFLTDKEKLMSYAKARRDFFEILDELGLKKEFKDFLEISFDFLKGEE